MRWLFRKIGLDKVKLDPEGIQNKFGFFGQPMFIGLIVGIIIAVAAKWNSLGTLSSWSTIITTALTTAAILVIYPSVSGLFVKGLVPLSTSINESMSSGRMKRKNMYIGIDPAVFFGESANLATGLLLIPFILLFAFVLPGNDVLPLGDVAAMPFLVIPFIAIMSGNILCALISSGIWMAVGMYCMTATAPLFTAAATATGSIGADVTTMVTSFVACKSPINFLVLKAFSADEGIRVFTIAAAVIVYLVVYFFFRKHTKKFQKAAGATEEYFTEKEALWKKSLETVN